MKKLFRSALALALCLCLGIGGAALAEDDSGYEMAHGAYGVTAADEIYMGTALAQLMENAAAEGEEIAVYGVDEMLAGAEFSAMEALRPAEQALVILTIMGRSGDIEAAKADLDIDVSEDAQALMDAVTARLASMSEEEWTEFEGLMEEYFPTVDSDGVPLLQLTLILSGAKSERIRMSFAQGGDDMYLSQIDIKEGDS